MRVRTRAIAAAGITAFALLATACGGGSGNNPAPANSQAAGTGGGAISVRGCTPQNPLVPGNTAEVCGGNVLNTFVATLVHYNVKAATPENDIADSIQTKDNQNFT